MELMFIAFVAFVILLVLGVPIAFSMGLSASIAIIGFSNLPTLLVAQRMYSGVDSFTLMAIPFFMLAGEFMEVGGLTRRLVKFSKSVIGHVTGGLGMVDILTSVIFAGVSGSAAADTAAVGSMLIPAMKKEGYPRGFCAVLQATAGSLGPIIPPSLTMIIFASLTKISISDLFLAGVIPGIMIGLGCGIITYIYAKKHGIRGSSKRSSIKEILVASKDSIFALFMPIIIIGGIVLGVFTPTEAGVVAVVYSFLVGKFVYKEYTFKDIPNVIIRAASFTAMAMMIIAGAAIFSWLVAYVKLPAFVIGYLTQLTDSPYIIMFLLVVFLLFVGMFIETLSATIITAPILMPIAIQYGIDPIQFALIMVIVLVYAGVTPPVGGVLFITMGISESKMKEVLPYLGPFLGIVAVVVALLIFFPQIALFIPAML